jgi:hypothetical protein
LRRLEAARSNERAASLVTVADASHSALEQLFLPHPGRKWGRGWTQNALHLNPAANAEKQGAAGITQPRPATPVNGAGGMTSCDDNARPRRSFLDHETAFKKSHIEVMADRELHGE